MLQPFSGIVTEKLCFLSKTLFLLLFYYVFYTFLVKMAVKPPEIIIFAHEI